VSGFQTPLAHLKFPVERSRGRRYPEFTHAYRNDFQRDRDRDVHARAFRRLEDKTQVFADPISDHFRNRLTHTIEVSQIARTVATTLGLNENLTEALALAHDIGHPPFGHAGEAELNRLMQRFGESFDHNLQALRIVEKLENPSPRFPGLNLTFEVREGIVKHSRDLGSADAPLLNDYLPGFRPPIEAQLIDLCDEIAYNGADLGDGYEAGLVSIEAAQASVPQFAALWDDAESMFPGAPENVRLQEVIRGLIGIMAGGLIEGTAGTAKDLADFDSVRAQPERVVRFTPAAAQCSRDLKLFLRAHVYQSAAVRKATESFTGRMEGLFDYLMKNPVQLTVREDHATQPLHRQVCDYIASMTDGFFERTCDQASV
jgi:dGTPase